MKTPLTPTFYQTPSGNSPVLKWLRSLNRAERVSVSEDIEAAAQGWPQGLPLCRPLGGGLYEVRSSLRNRIARVIFHIDGSQMWLLHGFIKKQQKTPLQELQMAKKRLKALSAARR